ncbi:MAG: imidazoleglycerol-phosphate dehydratase HisB [Phycisphaeraceae bacterium]|nr:imidazoleglycerol-phosphate dehydratase HisB [Phycisphaeraceae bacterium]
MSGRTASVHRETRETRIEGVMAIDGRGDVVVSTGIGFLDHLITSLATHAGWDLVLRCEGDLDVDDHHTAEDCGLVLGMLVDQSLGARRGIRRFGCAHVPMDESLARAAIDLVTRSSAVIYLGLKRHLLGALACENIDHVLRTFAHAARCTLHVDVLRGENDHHRAEAAFKALAMAFREAASETGADLVPSTKGAM